MKTKNVLFALCLPIAFTACQNEEFVKDYSQELKNRGEIDVILSASYPKVGNSVDTRMSAEESGNSLSFLWEQTTDKLVSIYSTTAIKMYWIVKHCLCRCRLRNTIRQAQRLLHNRWLNT